MCEFGKSKYKLNWSAGYDTTTAELIEECRVELHKIIFKFIMWIWKEGNYQKNETR